MKRPATEKDPIILFGGDCHFGDKRVRLDGELRRRVEDAAFVVVNQESPITDLYYPSVHKEITLKSSTRSVDWLQHLGVKIASVANNHIADYGEQGLLETISRLEAAGTAPVGAGVNSSEAYSPVYVDLPDGQVVAFLAFTSRGIESRLATERDYGCAELEPVGIERAVLRAREKASHVVLLLHYGLTNFKFPTPRERALLRSFAGSADLIVGHHPHVIQGYEMLDGTPICYSLGNLIFASYLKRGNVVRLSLENRRGVLVAAAFSSRGVRIEDMIFTEVRETEDELYLAISPSPEASARRFEARSRHLAHRSYEAFFRNYTAMRLLYRLLLWTSPRRWANLSTAQLRGFWLSLLYAIGQRR
jgi:poly-gamma-glutamate capsule biosynthesis protein CapA/YwtB (metallophosphatase superfamily)